MGNKRNIQGEHKEKKKPNLLKLVNQKRNKLIDIYQKIYIQQTGLSVRDPRYNRKAGSDRVKALERGWPKGAWNQLIPLFDTAIGDANLELGQGVLAAGAAAVGVAPVEPARSATSTPPPPWKPSSATMTPSATISPRSNLSR